MSHTDPELAAAKRQVLMAIAVAVAFVGIIVAILLSQFSTLEVPAMAILIAIAGSGVFIISKKLRQLALILEGQMPDLKGETDAIARRRAEHARRDREDRN
jgi:ABC-type nickel/cobalt efflux system permease component RcnA